MEHCLFRMGDTVIFDEHSFNPEYWHSLSEEEKIRYYGDLGYGQKKPKPFTFITEMYPQIGHCILIDIQTGKIETMRHSGDFRLATDEEC